MNGRTFDDFQTTHRGRPFGSCPRCGTGAPTAGMVQIALTKGTTNGGDRRRLASKNKNLCETCAIGVYEALLELFDAEITP